MAFVGIQPWFLPPDYAPCLRTQLGWTKPEWKSVINDLPTGAEFSSIHSMAWNFLKGTRRYSELMGVAGFKMGKGLIKMLIQP